MHIGLNTIEMYIQFGKYKYTEYKKIPSSYMAWLLKQDLNDWLRCILGTLY